MKHVTGQIQNWLSGELTQAECRAFEDHLKGCGSCAAEAAEESSDEAASDDS